VTVRLERTCDAAIQVSVCDDGIGLSESRKPTHGGGMGMHTMYYRARIIGATMDIQPNTGGGTRVICRLPAPKENEADAKDVKYSLPGRRKRSSGRR
jgi:signal transduction histidine kinase